MVAALMRKYQRIILLPVGVLMAIVFGATGIMLTGRQSNDIEVPGWGIKIPYKEIKDWSDRHRINLFSYRRQGRKDKAAQSLFYRDAIQSILLQRKAKMEGFRITDKEIIEKISSFPYFQNEKKEFDPVSYDRALNLFLFPSQVVGNMTIKEKRVAYEKNFREDTLIDKLKSNITQNVIVSDKDIREVFHKKYDKLTYEFAVFKNDPKKAPKPTEKQVQELHQKLYEEDPRFKSKHALKIAYILFPYVAYKDDLKISEERIKKYYEEYKEKKYKIKKKKNKEKSKKEKEKEKEKNDKNKEIKTLKNKKDDSKDKNEKDKGKNRNQDKSKEKKKEPEFTYKPLKEVHDQIKENLFTEEAKKLAKEDVDEIFNKLGKFLDEKEKNVDLKAGAKKVALKKGQFGETVFFNKTDLLPTEMIDALGKAIELQNEAFDKLEKNKKYPSKISTFKGELIYMVTDENKPTPMNYKEGGRKVALKIKEKEIIWNVTLQKASQFLDKSKKESWGKALKHFKYTSQKETKQAIKDAKGKQRVAITSILKEGKKKNDIEMILKKEHAEVYVAILHNRTLGTEKKYMDNKEKLAEPLKFELIKKVWNDYVKNLLLESGVDFTRL